MEIDRMREIIVDKLCVYPWEMDVEIETSPDNYGLENISIAVGTKEVWVEVPARTFSFNGELSFFARLAATGRSGYDEIFSKTVSGAGLFEFVKNSTNIEINNITINKTINLYEGNPNEK